MPTALITGASAGLGAEFARQLAAKGADLVLVARGTDALNTLAGELRTQHGVAVEVLAADLAQESDVTRVAERIADAGHPIDLLVNNAGFGLPLQFADNDIEDEVRHLRVHVEASMRLMHAGIRAMRGRGGRIINFTSQGFWSGGYGGSVAYAATKGGIVSMTRGLARSLAKDRITVNAVSPGAADTAMMRSGMTDEGLEAVTAQIPLGYMAAPSELAGTVVFLASDHASYITGATINVSGGWLMY